MLLLPLLLLLLSSIRFTEKKIPGLDPLQIILRKGWIVPRNYFIDEHVLSKNGIIPVEKLACGAFGCTYRACKYAECNLAVKIGEILPLEPVNARLASDAGIAPYFHAHFNERLSFQRIGETHDYLTTHIEGTYNHTSLIGNIQYVVYDFFPQTLNDFFNTDIFKDNITYTSNEYPSISKHQLLQFFINLYKKSLKLGLKHADMHPDNLMIGDLNSCDARDTECTPIVMIDLAFSEFNQSCYSIAIEWARLIENHYFYFMRNLDLWKNWKKFNDEIARMHICNPTQLVVPF